MPVVERTDAPASRCDAPTLVGASTPLRRVIDIARRVGAGHAKVLITGESGVGKELFARLVHAGSPRAHAAFIALNCASVSESLLESELFGHARGSFTGAYRDRAGKLQLAHKGTIFLDEIGEMSLRMQAMLLRFLENGEIQPVGAEGAPVRVDVRVVSATNRDLPTLVARGEFREDLLYRIRVAHIHVPPLRERREDIRPLVAHSIERSGQPVRITEEALRLLEAYSWPGNVRELQNVVEQMIAMSEGPDIGVEDLPHAIGASDRRLLSPARERRRRVSDDLFDALSGGTCDFWGDVYPSFMKRDLTRLDLKHLVGRGLKATGGNYRAVLRLFRIPDRDYKRFLNFLASHECTVDFREYRSGGGQAGRDPGGPAASRPGAPGDGSGDAILSA